MEMNEIMTTLLNGGTAIAVIAFFMYRDLKFMTKLSETLATLNKTVAELAKKEQKTVKRYEDENGVIHEYE